MQNIEPIISLLKDLIRFRSTADRPEELKKCVDYIQSFFSETNFNVECLESNGKSSIVVTKGVKTPKIFLYGHFDVVEGSDNQFEPVEKNGRIYGRGSMDMKSGLATFMHVMKEFESSSKSVGAMFVSDEEVGGFDGLVHLLAQGYSSEVVLMPDGGDKVERIVSKEKGLIRVKLTAEGKEAHGSRVWLGVSANELLIEAIANIKTLFTPVKDHPHNHWVPTFNVGSMSGGSTFNIVSGHATADCDVRITEEEPVKEITDKVRALLPKGVSAEFQVMSEGFSIPTDHPLVQSYMEVVKTVGRMPEFFETHGRSDACFLMPKGIIPVQGQPDGENLHAKDEWVSAEGIADYCAVVREYINRVG